MQQEDSSIGQVIDGYRILEVLGKGGMGIVYKAEDIALSRAVAIKMIAPELASNESFLRRFHSEARALARVESPFIVGIHALRQVEESFFIVMEYVDGWTLADEIEKGILEFSRSRVVLRQMLQAFARAHSVGVIHRDIKPRNIMITKAGRVKVTDFGLAKLRQDDGMSTVTQGMAGTARYMSPEQVLGTELDHRSDLYSLGMTMYEMLAGVLPFGVEEGTFAILKRIVEEDLPSPLEYNPNIPNALVDIVQKAIQKDPSHRFQTAQQMLEALDEVFRTKQPVEAPTVISDQPEHLPAMPEGARKKADRKPLVIAAVVVGLLLIYPVSLLISGEISFGGEGPSPLSEQGGEQSLAEQLPLEMPSKMAALTISSMPAGAMVVVDNESRGIASNTGLKLEVPEGEITLALKLDGYRQLDTTIHVIAESLNSVALHLTKNEDVQISLPVTSTDVETAENDPEQASAAMGFASLIARPAGTIYVNGDSYRDSTASLRLPVGRHNVRFEDRNTGASSSTTIEVRADKAVTRICYFQHTLAVLTQWDEPDLPPYANIFMNGKDLGPTPLGDFKLDPGEYTIALKRNGFLLSDPQKLSIQPTYNPEDTDHKLFFTIKKEQ